MESLYDYDGPRAAPKPATFNQISSERVPEISITLPPSADPKKYKSQSTEHNLSYQAWKMRNQCTIQSAELHFDKENTKSYTESVSGRVGKISCRKHVRFNSPNVQKAVLKTFSRNQSATNTPTGAINTGQNNQKANSTFDKSFEEIYMANIPNKRLDLSLIKSSTTDDNSNLQILSCIPPATNNCFAEAQIDELKKLTSQTAGNRIYENCQEGKSLKISHWEDQLYYRNTDRSCRPPSSLHKDTCKSVYMQTSDSNKEAMVSELLKVIQQQNEQIFLLQKQVALLLQGQSNQDSNETCNKKHQIARECTATGKIGGGQYNRCETAGTLSKLAIDVMTSFEVSFRSPPANLLQNEVETQSREVIERRVITNTEETTNCNSVLGNIKEQIMKDFQETQNVDLSLTLNEPVQVAERCPSPENSIHVDMKDYSSDTDDDSTSSSDIGWTIYNNVMGQVNNMLKNVEDAKDIRIGTNADLRDTTLRKAKEATMKHLRNIGVNLPPIFDYSVAPQRPNETTAKLEYSPTEIAFAVKQLLMKYLPGDQLTKLTQTTTPTRLRQTNGYRNTNTEDLIKRRPDFSFATLEYMKKYNLLTSGTLPVQPSRTTDHKAEVAKILDVTALKQQPKLL